MCLYQNQQPQNLNSGKRCCLKRVFQFAEAKAQSSFMEVTILPDCLRAPGKLPGFTLAFAEIVFVSSAYGSFWVARQPSFAPENVGKSPVGGLVKKLRLWCGTKNQLLRMLQINLVQMKGNENV